MLWYVHVVKYNLNTTMVQIYAERHNICAVKHIKQKLQTFVLND